jgi:hypothetical protein
VNANTDDPLNNNTKLYVIRESLRRLFPTAEFEVLGSHMLGLARHDSDLDVRIILHPGNFECLKYGQCSSYGPVFLLWASSSTVEPVNPMVLKFCPMKEQKIRKIFSYTLQHRRSNSFHGRAAGPQ